MTAFYIFAGISLAIIIACIIPRRKKNDQSITEAFEVLREQVGAKAALSSQDEAIDNTRKVFAELDDAEVRRHRPDTPFDLMPRNPIGLMVNDNKEHWPAAF